jgi:hypothetical protein
MDRVEFDVAIAAQRVGVAIDLGAFIATLPRRSGKRSDPLKARRPAAIAGLWVSKSLAHNIRSLCDGHHACMVGRPNAKGGLGMAAIPKKVAERLVAGLKRYQPILAAAKARDVGEADIFREISQDPRSVLSCA